MHIRGVFGIDGHHADRVFQPVLLHEPLQVRIVGSQRDRGEPPIASEGVNRTLQIQTSAREVPTIALCSCKNRSTRKV